MFSCNGGDENETPSVQENKNRVCFDTSIQAYRDDCDRTFVCSQGENGTPSVQENKNRVCFETSIQAYRDDCDRTFVCSQGERSHQHLIYPPNTLHL